MKAPHRSQLFLLTCLLLPLPLTGLAQGTESASRIQATAERSPGDGPGLSFKFPGGTLGDLAALLMTEAVSQPGAINLIVRDDARALPLPPFELRDVDAPAFVRAIQLVLGSIPGFFLELAEQGSDLDSTGKPSGSSAPWVFVAGVHPTNRQESTFKAFPVLQLLVPHGPYTIDTVVSAIREAWELDPRQKATEPRIKFHEPSGVLLVVGTQSAIDAAACVMGQLVANYSAAMKTTGASPAQSERP
jgi:hypothetical protein